MHRLSTEKPVLGVRTFHYHDQNRNRPIVVEVWYPAERQGSMPSAALDDLWLHPREVRDAAMLKTKEKYPLILISHGHRGGRREMSWLAEKLAQQGYVIAAVDHFGDMRAQFDLVTTIRFWERPRDVSFMLDQLMKESMLRERIDMNRIGFIGYSLGGMTGLSLAGAQAENVRQVIAKVNKTLQEFDPGLLDQFDFSEGEKSYADPRIQAMLLLCPATYVFPSSSLDRIKIPIGLVAAIGDDVLPFQDHAFRLIQHVIPSKLKVLREEISHYAFLNRLTDAGKAVLHKAFSNDHPCCSRVSIHQEVGSFAVDFFREMLGPKKHKE